jgi:hypothetical protein
MFPQLFRKANPFNRLFILFALLVRITLILAFEQLFRNVYGVIFVNIQIAILIVHRIGKFLFGRPPFPILKFLNKKTVTKLAFLS